MLIFRLLSVLSLVLLNGCASAPEQQPIKSEKSLPPQKILAAKPPKPQQSSKTSINPDVMFMLLTAELAGQRGQYDLALEGYLEAAKRVKDPRFAERASMIAMYMKDSKKLNDALALWLAQDSNNLTARKLAALSALRVGDQAAATMHIETLLREDPAGFEKSVLELAGAVHKENLVSALEQVLEKLALAHPDKAIVYYMQAVLAMQRDDKHLADTKIEQALHIQSGWDKALMLKAQLAVLSGNFAKAKQVLEAASDLYPKDAKFKKLLAQVLINAKEYKSAAQLYQTIIADNPQDGESQFALALVYLQLTEEGRAQSLLEKLQKDAEWRYRASFYLAKISEKSGSLNDALVWYDKTSDGPFAFDAAVSAISLLAKDKQFAEAELRLGLLSSKYPKQKLRVALLKSEVLNQQKRYQEAFDLLSTVLVEQPDDSDVLYARALLADRLGKFEMLEADLKKILQKYPENAEVLNALGYSLANKTTRFAEAESYLLRALKLAPDQAVILDSYGWLLFRQGEATKSLDYLQRAYERQKENEIAAHLAEVLWFLNRKDEAKKLFKDAFKQAPEDEYLLDFKKRFIDELQ